MARPCPEASRNEAAFNVDGSPLDVCSRPLVRLDNTRVLICLIGVLLIVRRELECEINERERAEDVVGSAQTGGLLEYCNIRRSCQQQENYVLNDGCK